MHCVVGGRGRVCPCLCACQLQHMHSACVRCHGQRPLTPAVGKRLAALVWPIRSLRDCLPPPHPQQPSTPFPLLRSVGERLAALAWLIHTLCDCPTLRLAMERRLDECTIQKRLLAEGGKVRGRARHGGGWRGSRGEGGEGEKRRSASQPYPHGTRACTKKYTRAGTRTHTHTHAHTHVCTHTHAPVHTPTTTHSHAPLIRRSCTCTLRTATKA